MKELLGLFSDFAGTIGAIFAFFAWLNAMRMRIEMKHERERLNEKISLMLQLRSIDPFRNDNATIELPISLRRAELTRAELLGRIGMIPMREKGRRFSLEYLGTPEFLARVDELQRGDEDILVIPCSADELDQFNLS